MYADSVFLVIQASCSLLSTESSSAMAIVWNIKSASHEPTLTLTADNFGLQFGLTMSAVSGDHQCWPMWLEREDS